MNEIKCPKCGTVFQINETDYESIVKQIRNTEFAKEIEMHDKQHKINEENEVKLAVAKKEQELTSKINNKDLEISNLKNELDKIKTQVEKEYL